MEMGAECPRYRRQAMTALQHIRWPVQALTYATAMRAIEARREMIRKAYLANPVPVEDIERWVKECEMFREQMEELKSP